MVMMTTTTLLPSLFVLVVLFLSGTRTTTGFLQPAKNHCHLPQTTTTTTTTTSTFRNTIPQQQQSLPSPSPSALHLKVPKKTAANDDEKVKQKWDLGLFLVYMTPWKNPNSIFVYMLVLLYGLGKYSESMAIAREAAAAANM